MPILSFSVKKDELLNHTKIDTTRVFTLHRWQELVKARDHNGTLYLWWKPRTKEKEHLFDSKVYGLWFVGFMHTLDGLWPYHGGVPEICATSNPYFVGTRPYTPEEVADYVRGEGFETLDQFLNVLQGKDAKRAGGSIVGKPLIRVRFWSLEQTLGRL